MERAAPTRPEERIVLLDALRGFALLGVLLVNLRDLTLFSFLSEPAQAALPTARWDQAIDHALTALVDVKAFTGLALFYGIGAGLGPRFGLIGAIVAGIIIFVLQVIASRAWLTRFRFGPLEWLWRSLTYGKRQPLRCR